LADIGIEAAQESEGHHLTDGPDWWTGHVVSVLKMLDEDLMASVDLAVDTRELLGMKLRISEEGRILIGEFTVFLSQDVSPAGADGDFESFAGFAHEEAEAAIEAVEGAEVLKCGSCCELVRSALEREAISRHPIVVVMLKKVAGEVVIRDIQSSCFQKGDLVLVAFEGFYGHCAPPFPHC